MTPPSPMFLPIPYTIYVLFKQVVKAEMPKWYKDINGFVWIFNFIFLHFLSYRVLLQEQREDVLHLWEVPKAEKKFGVQYSRGKEEKARKIDSITPAIRHYVFQFQPLSSYVLNPP